MLTKMTLLSLALAGLSLTGAATLAAAQTCSCAPHIRVTVIPPDRTERVSPIANVFIVVSGAAGLEKEAQWKANGSYQLLREGSPEANIPISVDLIGNLVRVAPSGMLRDLAWHRLEVDGQVVTRFQTGRSESMATPPKGPEIIGVRQGVSQANTASCSGRTHTVDVEVRDIGFDESLATLYYWELSYSKSGRWIPLQAAPVKTYDRRMARYVTNNRITVGHGQCGCGPLFPKGNQFVRMELVRVDGKRWESGQQNLLVNY